MLGCLKDQLCYLYGTCSAAIIVLSNATPARLPPTNKFREPPGTFWRPKTSHRSTCILDQAALRHTGTSSCRQARRAPAPPQPPVSRHCAVHRPSATSCGPAACVPWGAAVWAPWEPPSACLRAHYQPISKYSIESSKKHGQCADTLVQVQRDCTQVDHVDTGRQDILDWYRRKPTVVRVAGTISGYIVTIEKSSSPLAAAGLGGSLGPKASGLTALSNAVATSASGASLRPSSSAGGVSGALTSSEPGACGCRKENECSLQ